jgi:hypothetical protein
MRLLMGTLVLAFGVAGCASVKTLQATGGSRSDGTVELSYEYGSLEAPQVQWEQGLVTARERCAAWGYSDAEAFGGHKSTCQEPSRWGCSRHFVTMTYQCIAASDSKGQVGRVTADVPAPQVKAPPARPLPARVPAPVEAWEPEPNRNILAR